MTDGRRHSWSWEVIWMDSLNGLTVEASLVPFSSFAFSYKESCSRNIPGTSCWSFESVVTTRLQEDYIQQEKEVGKANPKKQEGNTSSFCFASDVILVRKLSSCSITWHSSLVSEQVLYHGCSAAASLSPQSWYSRRHLHVSTLFRWQFCFGDEEFTTSLALKKPTEMATL